MDIVKGKRRLRRETTVETLSMISRNCGNITDKSLTAFLIYRDTNDPVSCEPRAVFTFHIVFTLNSCDISTILK